MWKEFNINPNGLRVGDCVIRAISKALKQSWRDTYIELCLQGLIMGDMPSSNAVWSAYLKHKGFKRCTVQDCPDCYSVEDFCKEHPNGVYIVGTGTHAVAVENGNIYDAWNSSQEIPTYYFERNE